MTSCKLCHTFVHDTLETSVREKFPKRYNHIQPILHRVAGDFTKALTDCMTDETNYKIMVRDIHGYLPILGRETLQESFIKSVTPIRRVIGILEGDLFDAGFTSLVAIRLWLKNISFDMFMVALDIHLEHSGAKPAVVPIGQPLVALQKKKGEDALYF